MKLSPMEHASIIRVAGEIATEILRQEGLGNNPDAAAEIATVNFGSIYANIIHEVALYFTE